MEPWGLKIQENRRFFEVLGALGFQKTRKPKVFQGFENCVRELCSSVFENACSRTRVRTVFEDFCVRRVREHVFELNATNVRVFESVFRAVFELCSRTRVRVCSSASVFENILDMHVCTSVFD